MNVNARDWWLVWTHWRPLRPLPRRDAGRADGLPPTEVPSPLFDGLAAQRVDLRDADGPRLGHQLERLGVLVVASAHFIRGNE